MATPSAGPAIATTAVAFDGALASGGHEDAATNTRYVNTYGSLKYSVKFNVTSGTLEALAADGAASAIEVWKDGSKVTTGFTVKTGQVAAVPAPTNGLTLPVELALTAAPGATAATYTVTVD